MLMVLQQFTFGTRKIQASAVNSDPSDLKLKAWAKVPVVRTGENTVLFRTSYTHHSMLLCDMWVAGWLYSALQLKHAHQDQKQKTKKKTNFYDVILDDSSDNCFRQSHSLHREKQCAMSVFLRIWAFYAKTREKNNQIELEYSMLGFCSLQYWIWVLTHTAVEICLNIW